MSRDHDQSVERIEDLDQLRAYFRSGEKSPEQLGFGTEHEKFVFRRDHDYTMLSFEEPGGFATLFDRLHTELGWEPSYDRGNIVALVKDGAAITLEPGGQLELSGAITRTVFETEAELDAHLNELKQLAGERLAFACWGSNPFFGPDEIPQMPKARYEIMRRYLPTRADLGLWMMKTTCTVQGNYDYTSESDATDLIRTSLRVSPLVSALFASSPLRQGRDTGLQSSRCEIWTRTDPDRTGFPDFMYRDDWGYDDYLQYALDIPMFFIKRDNRYVEMTGRTFRQFMAEGYDGTPATQGDFELHLSTIFPEVRLKTYVETRGADAGSRDMILALPAIWKGILYDKNARHRAADLMSATTPDQHRACFKAAYTDGLRAHSPCGSFAELSRELVTIARDGLDAIAARDGHTSEAGFLAPLWTILEEGRTLADRLRDDFHEFGHDRERLVRAWEL